MVHIECQLRVTHNFKHTSPRLDKQRMELIRLGIKVPWQNKQGLVKMELKK